MKNIVYYILIAIILPIGAHCQTDNPIVQDTVTSRVGSFIDSVKKIEFAQINPFCLTRKIYIDSLHRKKKIQTCHAESILECVEIGGVLKCDLNPSRLDNSVEISNSDFSTLFKILYESGNVNYLASCYMPRHGILLYDIDDKQIGFIEICFECDRSLSTPRIPDFGFIPHTAYDELRKLFDKYGF